MHYTHILERALRLFYAFWRAPLGTMAFIVAWLVQRCEEPADRARRQPA